MATVFPQKNEDGKVNGYQAKVRLKGCPQTSKVFRSKRDAQEWATCSGLQSKTACSQSMGFFGSH
ncbi:hypothetical protein HF289_10625 [Acidithiobacillus ferrooxidans]|uniref:hypothetical protein n=1 Tax=Acidithiobacillus ferrooxidans TaxID=920 RepID=UPI001C07B1E8|nr:hypothetical protein [Acidithiobacillus ferrooxidans]MBU2857299.1 hypothetical protein [Acidithiobacillus ferrooxidans]